MPSYTLIKDILPEQLKLPTLNALVPDGELYSTLLFQHGGSVDSSIRGNDWFVRNQNREIAKAQFQAFFDVVLSKGIDLAITPEYSCPWNVIESLISDDRLPDRGKIWIIGCESIKPSKLRDFREMYKDQLEILTDSTIESQDTDRFLDPVCIFFKTSTSDGATEKQVLLIQFKTESMAGTAFEIRGLLRGEKRYIIHNEENNHIRLATIICSESSMLQLNDETLPGFSSHAYLLVHIQLNAKSRQLGFRNYRTNYYGPIKTSDKDLICLNWANGSEIIVDGATPIGLSSGGTSFYFKWHELEAGDQRVNYNDERGLFYNQWSYTAIFSFLPVGGLFMFENYKCIQRAPAAALPRSGPQMRHYFKWTDERWEQLDAPDMELSGGVRGILGAAFDDAVFKSFFDRSMTYLDIERLLLLSNGEATLPEVKRAQPTEPQITIPWTYAPKLASFQMTESEYSRRLTYLHEIDQESIDWKFKNYYGFLKGVKLSAEKPDLFFADERFAGFRAGFRIQYERPNYNLVDVGGKKKGTLAYLGECTEVRARLALEVLTSLLGEEELILVAYSDLRNDIKVFYPGAPKTGGNGRKGTASITGRQND